MLTRRRFGSTDNIWPGFVNALATLLIVTTFALIVFLIAQYRLTEFLSGRDTELESRQRKIEQLEERLAIEKQSGAGLQASLSSALEDLRGAIDERDQLAGALKTAETNLLTAEAERRTLTNRITTLQHDLTTARTQARTTDEVLASRSAKLAEHRERLRVRGEELQAAEDSLGRLLAAHEAMETRLVSLADAVNLAQARSESAETRLESSETRLLTTRNRLQTLQLRLATTKAEGAECQQTLKRIFPNMRGGRPSTGVPGRP